MMLTKLARVAALSLPLVALGCADETGVKKETTIETPSGTTTVTDEKTVETTGSHSPNSTATDVTAPVVTPPADGTSTTTVDPNTGTTTTTTETPK